MKKFLAFSAFTDLHVNFRGNLLRDVGCCGYSVIAVSPDKNERAIRKLESLGVQWRQLPLQRTGLNPLKDFFYLVRLLSFLRSSNPEYVFAYNAKPVIYVSLASRILGIEKRFVLISGLGYLFSEKRGLRSRLVQRTAFALYRLSLKGVKTIFFQNSDDEQTFRDLGFVRGGTKTVVVNGSGVDLEGFSFRNVPEGAPKFLLMARLVREKGVIEFVEAAMILRKKYPEAKFQIVGWLDTNPGGISEATLNTWISDGVIEFFGFQEDPRPFLEAASVFVLPSYYMEGVPRSLIEALSTGRAVVTTDHRGCRETVENGVNGFMVKPRNIEELVIAMEQYLTNPDLIRIHGKAGRVLAERKFDVKKVNEVMLREMGIVPGIAGVKRKV